MTYTYKGQTVAACDPNASSYVNCVTPYVPGGYSDAHSPGGSYHDSKGNAGGQIVTADGTVLDVTSPQAWGLLGQIVTSNSRVYNINGIVAGLLGVGVLVFAPGDSKLLAALPLAYAMFNITDAGLI